MKNKIISLLFMFLFSINIFAFAESEISVDQKKELLKMIYFQAVELAKEDINGADFFATALMKLTGEDDADFERTLAALLQSVDEYGDYITKEDTLMWQADLTGQSGGIGATVEMRNGRVTIANVLPGSPAEKAGIKADYVILRANGTDLSGMSLNKALSYVRGEIGSAVDILFEISEGETVLYTITRDKIEIKSVSSKILGENENIGYVNISNFSTETGAEFSEALKEFKVKGIDKMILDLRYNGGGDLQGAVEVCDSLLKKGETIVTIEPKDVEQSQIWTASGQEYSGEIVVLVNGYSASASEVVTGALKDNKRAVVIGEKTYGKGTVQNLYNMIIFGGMYKFTTAYYKTPNGTFINKVGISPNLTVENEKHRLSDEEMPKFTFLRELKQGDSGVDVLELKKALNLLYFKAEENENYDYELTNAVKGFQQSINIETTGEADIYTLQAINNLLHELEFYDDTQLEAAINYLEGK